MEDLEATEMFCDFPSDTTTFPPDFVMLKPGSLPSLDTWEDWDASLEDFRDIFFLETVCVGAIFEEASTVMFLPHQLLLDY